MSLSAFPLYEILTAPAINKTYGYIQSGDISLLFINHGTPFCYHFSKMCIPLPSRGKTDIKHLWSYEIIPTKSSSMYDKHNRHIFFIFSYWSFQELKAWQSLLIVPMKQSVQITNLFQKYCLFIHKSILLMYLIIFW